MSFFPPPLHCRRQRYFDAGFQPETETDDVLPIYPTAMERQFGAQRQFEVTVGRFGGPITARTPQAAVDATRREARQHGFSGTGQVICRELFPAGGHVLHTSVR